MDANPNKWICKDASDEQLIKMLKEGGFARRRAEDCLFEKFFYMVAQMRWKFSKLSEEERLSAYSDAQLKTQKVILNGLFRGESSLKTFFRRIYFSECVDAVRTKPSNIIESLNENDNLENTLSEDTARDREESEEEEERKRKRLEAITGAMLKLGKSCREVIQLYREGYDFEEIAQILGFNNAHVARQTFFRCKEKLKEIIGL